MTDNTKRDEPIPKIESQAPPSPPGPTFIEKISTVWESCKEKATVIVTIANQPKTKIWLNEFLYIAYIVSLYMLYFTTGTRTIFMEVGTIIIASAIGATYLIYMLVFKNESLYDSIDLNFMAIKWLNVLLTVIIVLTSLGFIVFCAYSQNLELVKDILDNLSGKQIANIVVLISLVIILAIIISRQRIKHEEAIKKWVQITLEKNMPADDVAKVMNKWNKLMSG